MKVLELKGYKSLRALNAFHTLMLGLKMLPAYMTEAYEDFYARVDAMPSSAQENMIREAALFVNLSSEEVEALASFATDANGVAYSPANLKSLGAGEILNIIVAVCVEISKIKVDFVNANEKKNLSISA